MLFRIDRYIIKSFIPAFIICMFTICGIYIVVDGLQKLDDFIELGVKALKLALYYYAFMVPVFIAQLFPAITLIAVSLVLVRLAKNNEIMAMQVAGICLYRILLPIFVLSVLMSFAAVANQEFIIPTYAEKLKRVEQSTFGEREESNILVEDMDNLTLLRALNYNIIEDRIESIYIIKRYENGKKRFTISAKEGQWLGNNKWLLFDVVKHNYDRYGKWIAPAEEKNEYLFETTLTPDQLSKMDINSTLKSFKELKILCERDPNNSMYSVMFHSRVAYPLTNFVLLFLGIPFVIGFDKMSRNVFLRVGTSILICCAFYVLTYICTNLGNMGILHPILAAWLPIVIFGSFGLFLFEWMRL